MARLGRLFVPNQLQHVIQRGHNGNLIFQDQSDYQVFYGHLLDLSSLYKCEIHGYVLMPNHWHLLVTPWYETSLSRFTQALGRRYVRYFNDKYQRSGTLWSGRFRNIVADEAWFWDLLRYVEENPVRAGLIAQASDYQWSSAGYHYLGRTDHLITAHQKINCLHPDRQLRVWQYQQMVKTAIPNDVLQQIRSAINQQWVLGSDDFKKVYRLLQKDVLNHSPKEGQKKPYIRLELTF